MASLSISLIVAGVAIVWLTGLYLLQLKTRDAGVVDMGWSAGVGGSAVMFAVLGEGDVYRRLLLVVVGGLWGFRLAWYLLSDRVLRGDEDSRYAALRKRWGDKANLGFAVVFGLNALLIVLFSIPFAVVAANAAPFGGWAIAGVVVGLGAIAGESLADRQLQQFRKRPENKGRTCRAGLWRYSRHPNYFFEWLHWFSYVLLAVGGGYWWLALTGPIVMYLFLHRVTGIPYTERQAIRSRGDDYRAYQRETSAFFPWFHRAGAP